MNYTIIDKNIWARRQYFEHYFSAVPCTYSMTVKLNITNICEKGLKLYPAMLYVLTRAVNSYEQFRTTFNDNNELVIYSNMEPCYTVFHKETETFSNIWTAYSEDYDTFCRNYNDDILNYGNIELFWAKPDVPQNSFTVSMIPWTTFDGFNINVSDFKYLLPIFTIGKYFNENEKTYLPLAVQVHHAVCDGFHVCRFINDVQAQITAM